MTDALGDKRITQIGIIVRDIEATSQAYAGLLGIEVPHWFLTDSEDVAQTRYLGEPTQARAKLAFFDMGSVQLELIEPVGAPSTWQAFLDEHGEGVHHIAFQIKGMGNHVDLLADRDMPLVQKGEYTGGRYAYIDSTAQLKLMLELLEND